MPRSFFPILIVSLLACCIEVDISVPGFPDMARYFGVDEGSIQLTVAINFLGFCIAGFLYGPLSDCYGRRSMMVVGNFLLLLGALGCALAPSIPFLLAARLLQGVGAAASAVLVFAMIADVYQGEKSARLIGVMNSFLTTVMAVAPVAGGFINEAIGWRGNYTAVAVVSLISFVLIATLLPESSLKREKFSIRKISGDFKALFSSSHFMSYAVIPSLIASGYLSFIACGSFLYQNTFGLSILAYSIHQGLIVASFSIVSSLASKISARMGQSQSIIFGSSLGVVGAALMMILSLMGSIDANLTTLSMVLFATGAAIVYPVVFAASLEIFPDLKGAAASAIMGMRAFLISLCVGFMGYVYDGSALTVASVVLGILGFSALMTAYILRFEKKRVSA